jgi:hypothetical protein
MRLTTSIRNGFPMRCLGDVRSVVLAAMLASPVAAQQVILPSGNPTSVQPGVSSGAVNIPQTNLAPVATPAPTFGAAPAGVVPFDPYATQQGVGVNAGGTPGFPSTSGGFGSTIGPPVVIPQQSYGSVPPSPPGSSLFSRMFARPAGYPAPTPGYGAPAPSYGAPVQGFAAPAPTYGAPLPSYGTPIAGQPPLPPLYQSPAPGPYDNPNVYGPPIGYTAPGGAYPGTAYPSTAPSTMFPGGGAPGGFMTAGPIYSARRFLQGPRLRHTFVSGGSSSTSLQMNDTDTSLVFNFNNFLYSTQPLYVVPSFSLHLWDGPAVGAGGADLPANAYSAFLDFGWQSDANRMVGTELGIRLGIFSDFDTNNSDSFRALGKALVSFRCSPMWTFKTGLYYLDRNSIKLVPAFGFLWQPNPFTRVDLFVPQPRLARFWRTLGTRDVWWYLTGDYGGGSWTVRRANGESDSVDINDLRVILGFEWGNPDAIRAGRRTGFFEIGYVFNREIEYRYNPDDNIKPGDGIMLSAGFGY